MRFNVYLALLIILLANSSVFAQKEASGPLKFIENKGQWESNILYKADIPAGAMFLENNLLTFNLRDTTIFHNHGTGKVEHPLEMVNYHSFKINFKGANPQPAIQTSRASTEYYNYFIGNNPSAWASRVKGYGQVSYSGVYPGIDFVVQSNNKGLKYDFIVAPGANPKAIKLVYEGADNIYLDKAGNVIVETTVRKVVEHAPYVYQIINGVETVVECRYKLNGNELTYHFPKGYNKKYELVIDPVLVFGSYSGSTADNFGYTATYDQFGHLFAGGTVFGTGYPTTVGAYQIDYSAQQNGTDIAISKYSPDGTSLIYSTYLGGVGNEQPHSLCVNSNNELYVLATSGSADFPMLSTSYNTTFLGGPSVLIGNAGFVFDNGCDIAIARFSGTGDNLLSSTFYGGSSNDGINMSDLQVNYGDWARGELVIDEQDNVYIGSCTYSTNLPVSPLCYQPVNAGGLDGVIAKFDVGLTTLLFGTYFGGSNNDAVYSINRNSTGNLYFTGGTTSENLPTTTNVLHTAFIGGTRDAFIGKIAINGQQLLASTYFGTASADQAYFVQFDTQDNVCITGQTESPDSTLIVNAQFKKGGGNQFISKLNPNLNSIIWSTTFGKATGRPDLVPSAFLIDKCNKVYLSGWGGKGWGNNANVGGLPVTNNAFRTVSNDSSDYYLMVLDPLVSTLLYGTYYGGDSSKEHVDGGTSRFDKQGVIYQSVCAGCGSHNDFPTTPGSVSQVNNSSNCNNGVFKFDFEFSTTVADFSIPPIDCPPYNISFTNLSSGAVTYRWNFGDNTTSTQANPTHTYSQPGTYTVRLIARNPANCNIADTVYRQITLLGRSTASVTDVSTCPGRPVQIGIEPINTPGIHYIWQPAVPLNNDSIPAPIATVNANTTFTLLISNGICADTLRQNVVMDAPVPLNIGTDTTICPGATIQIGFAENSGNYNYNWTISNGTISNDTVPNPTVTPQQGPATYILYAVPDIGFGCPNRDTLVVGLQYTETVAAFDISGLGCAPYTVNFTNLSVLGDSYIWNFGDASPLDTAKNPAHTFLIGGVYTVQLISINNRLCKTADTANVSVIIIDTAVTDTLPPVYTCLNRPVQVGVQPSLDTTIIYSWLPTTLFDNDSIANPFVTPTADSTVLTLTIDAGNNCIGTYLQTVYFNPPVVIDAGNNITICQGLSGQIGFADTTNTLQYQWQPATGLSNDTIPNPTASPTQTTVYTLTATPVNPNFCAASDTMVVYVASPPPVANLTYTMGPLCNVNTLKLQNTSDGGTQFYWGIGGNYYPANTDTTLLVNYNTSYTYSIVAANAYCSDTFTVTINISNFSGYMVLNDANVFTPDNGDFINNCFSPILPAGYTLTPQSYPLLSCSELVVYNRWGRKVFEGNDCWNGYTDGGTLVSEGVYYYIFTIGDIKTHGTVTVLRAF